MSIADADVINKLAGHFEAIPAIKTAYGFAQNPDSISQSSLPCVMFYVPRFTNEPKAHYNIWKTTLNVRAILFVAPREGRGGRLKFLENSAIPFGGLVREKFNNATVINDLLTVGSAGTVSAWLTSGQYGAGMPELTHNGVPYIGWIFDISYTNIA